MYHYYFIIQQIIYKILQKFWQNYDRLEMSHFKQGKY